jgi:hypothetical protein
VDIELLKREFLNSAKRGTGEACIIIRNYPEIDFSKELRKVCLRNFSYDGQCESSRAPYLFDLISHSEKQEKIKVAIIKKLAVEERDTWSLVQLFDLAKIFAQQGEQDARDAIYNRYLNRPINGSDWAGYDQILELDGLEGLYYVAEKIGRTIETNPDGFVVDYIPDQFQKNNGDVMDKLESAAATNHYIGFFLSKVKKANIDQANYKREIEVFSDAIEEVLKTKAKPYLINKKWNNAELDKISMQLMIEKDKSKQTKLLLPFNKNKFPGDARFILQLATKHPSERNELGRNAINALRNIESASVRDFAIERILTDSKPDRFTGILKLNYKNGDYKLLTNLVEKTDNADVIESLTIQYVSIFNHNKTSECREPLEALYNKMTCGIHRTDIVKILMDNGVLSVKIRDEIKYDCNSDTRQLLNRYRA